MNPKIQQAVALSAAGRNDEAVHMIREVASGGDPDGLALLAEMTWRGGMVDSDPPRARTLYRFAAERGHAGAAIALTNLLASGVAGDRDWPQAVQRLEAEARAIPQRRRALELVKAMRLDAQGDPVHLPAPERLSQQPDVVLFKQLVSAEECAYLRDAVGQRYEPSLVYDDQRNMVRDPLRTSDGAAIHWLIEDPAVVAINRRIARATDSEYAQGEALALLRYAPGQQYHPHFDFVEGAANRRIKTALIYLNDDYDGGETAFVRTDLKVKGELGDVLVFVNDGGTVGPDPLSEHEGCPVTSGTKYLATRWIRESRWVP